MPSRQEHHILTRTSFGGGGSAHSVWGGGTYGSYQALAAAAAPPPPWQPSGGYQQWGYHHQSFLKWRTWTQPAGNPFLKGYDASQFVSLAHLALVHIDTDARSRMIIPSPLYCYRFQKGVPRVRQLY